MSNLIPIQDNNGQQVVSARDLWQFLESKKDFSDWIKHRIQKYGLTEGQDFATFSPNSENPAPLNGGAKKHNAVEYALTLDAAKELAMVEGNAKGKQARQYFIECEKALKENQPKKLSRAQIISEAFQILSEEKQELERELEHKQETILLQEKEIKKAAPKVEYFDKVMLSADTYTANQIAKELGMSAVTLNEKLRELKVQYKQSNVWLLYEKFQNLGLTKTRTYKFDDTTGPRSTSYTVWTEKGRKFIHNIIGEMEQENKLRPPVQETNKRNFAPV